MRKKRFYCCFRSMNLQFFKATFDQICLNITFDTSHLFQLTNDIFSYVAHLWEAHLSQFLQLAAQHDDNMESALEQCRLVLKGEPVTSNTNRAAFLFKCFFFKGPKCLFNCIMQIMIFFPQHTQNTHVQYCQMAGVLLMKQWYTSSSMLAVYGKKRMNTMQGLGEGVIWAWAYL